MRLDILIGTGIFGVLALIALVVLALALSDRTSTGRVRERGFAIGAAVTAFVFIALAVVCWFPFDSDYYSWNEKSGVVETIDERLVSKGNSMETKYVVSIDGQAYGCLDTRCAAVEPGDTLALNCHKVWEYGATHGWDCKFLSHQK